MRVALLLFGLISVSAQASEKSTDMNTMGEFVRPIVTTLYFANGSYQQNRGNGFIVGSQFFTAYHNIDTHLSVARKVIELGGVEVQPRVVDKDHDLALFDIPSNLCENWCNESKLSGIDAEGPVTWVHDVDNLHNTAAWRSGVVRNSIYKSAPVDRLPTGCEDDLVIEVDMPFYPGNSGGPVFDRQTGAIVGLIQGSFERKNGFTTGYYKPVKCLLERLDSSA